MNRVSLRALQAVVTVMLLIVLAPVPDARAGYQVGPLFPPHADYDYAPSMIREGNIDKFWWCGNDVPGGGGFKDVIYYRSVNITTMVWSPIVKVLRPSTTGWDSIHVCDPSVIRGSFFNPFNGQTYSYALYYTGLERPDGTDNKIGVAFSNDGVNWIKYGGNPVISPQVLLSGTYGAGQPATYNHGTGLILFHTDLSVAGMGERIWVRTSSNGINFSGPTPISNQGTTAQVADSDFGFDNNTGQVYALIRNETGNNGGGFGFGIYRMPEQQLLSGGGTWEVLGNINQNLTGYFNNGAPGLLRDGSGIVTPWMPAVAAYFSVGTGTPATWELTWTIWNPQPSTIPLKRYYNSTLHDHLVTSGAVPAGYSLFSTLGNVYMSAAANRQNLFGCRIGNDRFVSLAANCEGQVVLGTNGFVFSTQPQSPPTVPLYRCYVPSGDHFVSNQADCEGYINEGLLGFAPTQPQN